MLDQASKIDLLEMPVFSEGSGGSRKFSPGKLSVCLVGPGRASHCCASLVFLLHRQPGTPNVATIKAPLTAYDGGGDGRRRSQQRASQYDRRHTEINH
jgi:hypothetical protein